MKNWSGANFEVRDSMGNRARNALAKWRKTGDFGPSARFGGEATDFESTFLARFPIESLTSKFAPDQFFMQIMNPSSDFAQMY